MKRFKHVIYKDIKRLLCRFLVLLTLSTSASALSVRNAGFEQGLDSWQKIDKTDDAVKLSNESRTGSHSLKILAAGGSVQQKVTLSPNTQYELSVDIKGAGLLGIKVGEKIFFDRFKKSKKWQRRSVFFDSNEATHGFLFASFNQSEGRFDNFALNQTQQPQKQSISVVKSKAGQRLSPDLPPGQNFDLLGWSLNLPSDDDNNGKSDKVGERQLAEGYTHSDYFYTDKDGGMVMMATVGGAKTSKNTKNVRTELREMLRRGDKSINTREASGKPNKNNWVFSYQPESAKAHAGARLSNTH